MKADTSKGTAYHVAVKVEGAAGVAGVGIERPTAASGSGHHRAANSEASHPSDL